MRKIGEIIIHCAATAPEWMQGHPISAKVDEIRRWHKGRGWRDIGYHFIIDRDGAVMEGRPIKQVGAHTKGHNLRTIGICLLGGAGSNERDKFEDHFTPDQDRALRDLIARLPGRGKITGHNEHAAKACPGFQVKEWLKSGAPISSRPPDKRPAPEPSPPETGLLALLSALFAALFGGSE